MTDKTLKQHPLSAAFPAMSDQAFAELRADIAANGLHQSITLYDGAVLDGWHRQQVCVQTGSEAHYEVFKGDDDAARKFVVSINLNRRHLDTSQRAMVAGMFATMKPGQPKKGAKSPNTSVADLAALVNVGDRAVKDARAVIAHATPEVIKDVHAGKVSVSKAAKDIRAATPKPAPKPRAPKPTFGLTAEKPPGLLETRNPKAKLNQQKAGEDDNAIDWAKWTWNPITGCLHNCPYCYARDIAERFSGTPEYPNGFEPTLHPERLSAPLNTARPVSDDPREGRIFTGSMTDLFGRWVPTEWVEAVLGVMREAPKWEFLMLTKFPKRLAEFDIPANAWAGTSVDCQARVASAEAAFANVKAKVKWLSVEPLLEPLKFQHLDRFDLLVIGGASRSSKTPQWIPPYAWIDDLMRQANAAGCAVYLKSNLYLKEAPHGPRYQFADRAPEVFHYLGKASNPDQQVNAA